jgi:bacteriocin biosynthesis cyclodehydratase domain-containing protein
MPKEHIQVMTLGRFADAVYAYLQELCPDVAQTRLDGIRLPAELPERGGRIWIVVSWRPAPSICSELNKRSHMTSRPFVPVIVDNTALQLGPLVLPNQGACWECWVRRSNQHSPWPSARAELFKYYDANAQAGPPGYLEPLAMMAAAKTAAIIEAVDSGSAPGGYVWQMDMITRAVATSTVVGVHGCVRCGLGRSIDERTFSAMRGDLSWLFSNEA